MVNATVRSLAVVVATLLGAGAGAATAPAAAHTDFIGADPRDGATVRELPAEVRLEFSDDMDPGLSTVTLQDGAGGSTQLDLSNGAQPTVLVASVPDALGPEDGTVTRWTVTFRVVSRDGHPVAGTSTFVLRTPPSPGTSPASSPSSTADAGAPEPDLGSSTASDQDAPGGREPGNGDAKWAAAIGVGVLALLAIAIGTVMRLVGRDPDS